MDQVSVFIVNQTIVLDFSHLKIDVFDFDQSVLKIPSRILKQNVIWLLHI